MQSSRIRPELIRKGGGVRILRESGYIQIDTGDFLVTKLLDQALEAARNLPPDAQDDIARVVLQLTGADDETPVPLTPDEQAAIAASKAAAARGEFATDEQVRAVWAKHGL